MIDSHEITQGNIRNINRVEICRYLDAGQEEYLSYYRFEKMAANFTKRFKGIMAGIL